MVVVFITVFNKLMCILIAHKELSFNQINSSVYYTINSYLDVNFLAIYKFTKIVIKF